MAGAGAFPREHRLALWEKPFGLCGGTQQGKGAFALPADGLLMLRVALLAKLEKHRAVHCALSGAPAACVPSACGPLAHFCVDGLAGTWVSTER